MASKLIEQLQICEGFLPVNMATAANDGDYVSLKNYGHVAIVLFKGAGTAGEDPTITVQQATAVAGTSAKELTFTELWKKQAATNLQAVGTFTRVTQAAANTYTNTDLAEQAAIIVIEFDAEDLDVDNGFDCIQASVADVGTSSQIGGILYILSDPKHSPCPSALAD